MTTRTLGRFGTAAVALAAIPLGILLIGGRPHRPNVVIITLDTTRADRLSPYGFANVSLPSLERLAREGVVFDRALSVAPLTLPAHSSLFTGLLPPRHGVRDNADPALSDTPQTMAEVLRADGFRTGAFVGSSVLDADRGLKQGFDHYSDIAGMARRTMARQRPANEVVDEAIRWLDTGNGAPFLLWTHFYDAHRPYDPPEPFRSTYGHDLYLGEIAFADSQIGRLIDELERRHQLDNTVIIVTADHGESLGAHGERDHGVFVYDDVIRVPLIVRAPGLRPGRAETAVSLVDLMPTVLETLGITVPSLDGESLLARAAGAPTAMTRPVYSESLYPRRFGCSPIRALHDGRFKLIDAPRPELYDLSHDPFEEHNIYDSRRDVARTLALSLNAIKDAHAEPVAGRAASSPELQARLRSLGYVATPSRVAQPAQPLPDAKDCIASFGGI